MQLLSISPRDIRRHGKGNALGVLWRQWRTERQLARRGIHFRDTDPDKVARTYAAMSEEEFEGINARQDWANWRTIPRCLSGDVPDRPLRVLDLGCGTGGSTQVLAFYCPADSHITGYELAEPLVDIARRRKYPRRDGQPARVDFRVQGVTERFLDAQGQEIAAGSVDLVNASGVVGHHLNGVTVQPLIEEMRRVLRAEGVAALDVGPALKEGELRRVMREAGFMAMGKYKSWFGDPTGQVVFRR